MRCSSRAAGQRLERSTHEGAEKCVCARWQRGEGSDDAAAAKVREPDPVTQHGRSAHTLRPPTPSTPPTTLLDLRAMCAVLTEGAWKAERIECLNRLAAQPMVLAKIDAKKLASEASSEVKDMLLKQITEKIHADQKGDLDGASLMSRVKGTERSDEALLALQGVKRHLGYNEVRLVFPRSSSALAALSSSSSRVSVRWCGVRLGWFECDWVGLQAATVAAKAMADTADERMVS
eukprot:1075103-Rhodomonas_salina.2